MAEYVVLKVEWDLKKRNLKGALRKAKEVHIFIHTDYFECEDDAQTPRHKVTISYALEFIDKIPEDKIPGLVTISNDPLIYQLIPRAWEKTYVPNN